MAFINPRQITKYQNSKIVLEFNDKLFPANTENASNLHASFSKIHVVAVDTTNGKGPNAVVVECNLDPIKVKRLYEKVTAKKHVPAGSEGQNSAGRNEMQIGFGSYSSLTPSQVLIKHGDKGVEELEKLIPTLEKNAEKYPVNKQKIEQFKAAIEKYKKGELNGSQTNSQAGEVETFIREQKINPNSPNPNNKDQYKVTVFEVVYNPKMNNCWNILIEVGWGELEQQENGGFSIKKGTYNKEKSVKVFIDDEKFKEMLRQCNDYIMYFELTNFKSLMTARAEYEQKQKEAAEAEKKETGN